MNIIFSDDCLQFKDKMIPESPERVRSAQKYLGEKDYNFIEPEPCDIEDLYLVHKKDFVENVKKQDFHDPECPHYQNLFYYARLAAGGAVKAAAVNGFSLMRPPGHHAGKDFLGGFCYFNNLAIAVEKVGKKTLIVDFDAHHGNGTEDIFRGRDDVVYLSLHKNIYPGTGRSSGKNYLNHTFTGKPGDERYLEVLEQMLPDEGDFEIIAVSAGFDGYRDDPLAALGLTPDGYYQIGRKIAAFKIPVFSVLEGGYHEQALGENIHSFVCGLQEN